MRRPLIALLIGVFAAIVTGALFYFLGVGPRYGTIDKKQKEIEATENKIQVEQDTYRELSDIKARSPEYEARLAALQASIPADPGLPSLIRQIQAAADPGTGAGLPWLSFAPGEVESAGTGYSAYTFNMKVAGFYDDVVELVYRMERFQRAVVVDSISMTGPAEEILKITYSPNLGLVEADINATTFTFAKGEAEGEGKAATPTPPATPSE